MRFFHSLSPLKRLPLKRRSFPSLSLQHRFFTAVLISGMLSQLAPVKTAQAQTQAYCQFSAEAIAQKNNLRQAALNGDKNAEEQYQALIGQHAELLRRCRSQTWPQTQAIWIRLYPCDARPGVLEAVLDQIASRGYNQVNVEVFYNGQVLLPIASNSTPWPSTIRTAGYENRDLFAEAIAKGHERGLKVYAWMFSMNYGYTYAQRPEAEGILARNGWGQTSLTFQSGLEDGMMNTEEVFIDPYHTQAKREYYHLVQEVLKRRPDGVLFDYIRYPKGQGEASVVGRVQDLWVYGSASQQALYQRALNQRGLALIYRFLSRGYITSNDMVEIANQYPSEGEPLWQGRSPSVSFDPTKANEVQPYLQTELWQLSVAHAVQGVLDFLNLASTPVQQQGIPAGAVFFPEGNQVVGQQGYDSRLQAWDRFPSNLEWHPMAYANCGHTGCITPQVQRVLSMAPSGTQIKPVLAGAWGHTISNHPPLEQQMHAVQQIAPQVTTVSHFAYSWQEPQSDRDRKFCQL